MIANDTELECTQERITYFQRLLRQMRVATRVEEFPSMAGAYLAEVEKMHREVMEYLGRHASVSVQSQTVPAAAPKQATGVAEPAPQAR